MLRSPHKDSWLSAVKKVACLLIAIPVWGQADTVPPAFTGASEPNWSIQGSAWLTAAGRTSPAAAAIDAAGQGWLRLTDVAYSQSGSAVYKNAFSSADGVTVEFEYATWGGDGADGFTFYLLDGSVTNPATGASDGSLGYSSWLSAGRPGVPKGYLGVGFDEFGNFSNGYYGGCSYLGGPSCARTPNSIAVRGRDKSANGDGYGEYPLLASVPVSAGIGVGGRTQSRKVRITVTPAPTILLTVEVELTPGTGYQKFIDALNITSLNGAPPNTFKMGFSGGTGALTNNHEVRFLGVQGARTANVSLASAAPTCGVAPSRLTATITGSDPARQPTGTVTFLEGTTTLGSAAVTGGVATLDIVLPPGPHNIVARYSGDTTDSTVDSPASALAVSDSPCPKPVPGLQPWSIALLAIMVWWAAVGIRRRLG